MNKIVYYKSIYVGQKCKEANDKNSNVTVYQTLKYEGEIDMPTQIKKGSLRWKPKNKLYEYRYYEEGKQKSFYAKTKTEIIKFYKMLNKQAKSNTKPKTYREWLEEWYLIYKKPNVTSGSLYQNRNSMDKYILPHFKNQLLANIKPLDLQNLLNGQNRRK